MMDWERDMQAKQTLSLWVAFGQDFIRAPEKQGRTEVGTRELAFDVTDLPMLFQKGCGNVWNFWLENPLVVKV